MYDSIIYLIWRLSHLDDMVQLVCTNHVVGSIFLTILLFGKNSLTFIAVFKSYRILYVKYSLRVQLFPCLRTLSLAGIQDPRWVKILGS
jgi:hypothetical protein